MGRGYKCGAGGAGLKMEPLWENASPTSSFAEQTISVDLDGFDLYMIMFSFTAESQARITYTGEVGYDIVIGMNDKSAVYRRNVTYTATGLTISATSGTKIGTGSIITEDTYLVPIAIYGIKGGSA